MAWYFFNTIRKPRAKQKNIITNYNQYHWSRSWKLDKNSRHVLHITKAIVHDSCMVMPVCLRLFWVSCSFVCLFVCLFVSLCVCLFKVNSTLIEMHMIYHNAAIPIFIYIHTIISMANSMLIFLENILSKHFTQYNL